MATSSVYLTAFLVIAIGTRLNWALEKPKTLYLLTLLSYVDNDTSPITDGDFIIAGAELAVAEINNRSDLLENYRLELIPANDGCILGWKSVINLIDNLYYGGKQIVGIIGPECSDAVKAVASLTGKPEIPSKKFVRFNRQTINPFRSISTIFIMSGVLDLYASYLLTMHHTGILLDKSSSILREESQGSYTNSNDLLCTSCAIVSCRT